MVTTARLTLVVGQSADVSFSPIHVQLVAEHSGIQPDRSFTIGVYQKIESGFHTYWRNPGTIGLPTQVEWILPPGFKAGPLQWALPTHSQMADYRIWGYRQEALLLTTIEAPDQQQPGTPITIQGKASWMCCGKQCYPGFQTLSITLPVVSKPTQTSWKPHFDRVRAEQPRPFAEWQVTANRNNIHYTIQIRSLQSQSPLPKRSIQFFGFQRQISSDKAQQLKRVGNSYRLNLEHEEFSGEDHSRLTGMLVADPPWNDDFPQSPMLVNVALEFSEN